MDEVNVYGLQVFKKYKESYRRKQAEINKEVIIGFSSDHVANCDNSSGDDDEDKRAAHRVSEPRRVVGHAREKVTARELMTDVVYVLYSNQEIMRHKLVNFHSRYPRLLQEYCDTLDTNEFKGENYQLYTEEDPRRKVKLIATRQEEVAKIVQKRECPVTGCLLFDRKKFSYSELFKHVKQHCIADFILHSHNEDYICGTNELKAVQRFQKALNQGDVTALDSALTELPFEAVSYYSGLPK